MDDLIQILLLLAITVVPSMLGSKNKKKKEAERRRRMQQMQQEQQPRQRPEPQPSEQPLQQPKQKLSLDVLEDIAKGFDDVGITDLFGGFVKPSARRAQEKTAPVKPEPVVRRPVEEGSDGSLAEKMKNAVSGFPEPESEPEKPKQKIDLKNLVIYSEIMKPKYDEY